MDDGIAHLGSTIAAHLREWDTAPAFVELAVFGTDDAASIARAIDAFCVRNLGAPVAHGLFHQSSIGSVTGVCEYLSDRGLISKASLPVRLTKKSNINVDELAFFHRSPSVTDEEVPSDW